RGVMRAGVFSGAALLDASGRRRPEDELLAQVLETPLMAGADLAGEVTAARPYVVEPVEGSTPDGRPVAHVVAVDLGIKSTTPQRLAQRGVRTTVVPSSTTAADLFALEPDGVFFSNGPGDPGAAVHEVEL